MSDLVHKNNVYLDLIRFLGLIINLHTLFYHFEYFSLMQSNAVQNNGFDNICLIFCLELLSFFQFKHLLCRLCNFP